MASKKDGAVTYKLKCKCGAEFYVSVSDETTQLTRELIRQADEFKEEHKKCYTTQLGNFFLDKKDVEV